MGFWGNIVSGVVGAISASAIVTLFAMLWRRRIIQKYKLNQEAKHVLAALWDEGLIRSPLMIAEELDIPDGAVMDELENLKRNGLVRIRETKNGKFWKITLKGKEYLSQLSWLGDLI